MGVITVTQEYGTSVGAQPPPSHAVGIGLRHPHKRQILEEKPSVPWLEVHSENYMMPGGYTPEYLMEVREHYPISLHGVGMSLGSPEGLVQFHLDLLKPLIDRIDPFLLSDHICWNQFGHENLNDLLPIPYTEESLTVMANNLDHAQTFLKRQMLFENPSSYVQFKSSDRSEPEFMIELAKKSGAGILLDINNIYVSSKNHGWDAEAYLEKIPGDLVQEVHLAGHYVRSLENNKEIRIDTHDNYVCDDVWDLFEKAMRRMGPKPTLIEWDSEIPELSVLIAEAKKAEIRMEQSQQRMAV